jgi:hypothetical protein
VARRYLRPVQLCIDATIRPRRVRRGVRPFVSVQPRVRAVRPGVPVRRMAPMPMARPFRRFR